MATSLNGIYLDCTIFPTPSSTRNERLWFLLYGPISFAYRIFVVCGIVLFIGPRYFFIGIAVVAWLIIATFIWPAFKIIRFVIFAPVLEEKRLRAVTVTTIGAVLGWVILGLVPIPYGTISRGVVWIPEEARVVAETAGRCLRFVAEPGTRVNVGDQLVVLEDPYIASRQKNQEARLAELEARLTAAEPASPYETQVISKQIDFARDELAELKRRVQALTIISKQSGIFIVPHHADLIDGYVKKGDILGYVMADLSPVVRAIVPEDDIDPVRNHTVGVAVRFDGLLSSPVEQGRIIREYPEATRRLPHAALASANGGPFTVNSSHKGKNISVLPFFEVDIAVPVDLVRNYWGEQNLGSV